MAENDPRGRSEVERYVDVLRSIYYGYNSPLSMSYDSVLSYDGVMNCINFLVKCGLVQKLKEKKRKEYMITDRGKEVIEYVHKLEVIKFFYDWENVVDECRLARKPLVKLKSLR